MKAAEVQTLIDLIVPPDKRKELSAEKLMDNSLAAKNTKLRLLKLIKGGIKEWTAKNLAEASIPRF